MPLHREALTIARSNDLHTVAKRQEQSLFPHYCIRSANLLKKSIRMLHITSNDNFLHAIIIFSHYFRNQNKCVVPFACIIDDQVPTVSCPRQTIRMPCAIKSQLSIISSIIQFHYQQIDKTVHLQLPQTKKLSLSIRRVCFAPTQNSRQILNVTKTTERKT